MYVTSNICELSLLEVFTGKLSLALTNFMLNKSSKKNTSFYWGYNSIPRYWIDV